MSHSGAAPKMSEFACVMKHSKTIADEPLSYPNTAEPEISSYIVPIAPGETTRWMTHPEPAFLYVLEGRLTVEFADDGTRKDFEAGESFLQAQLQWHRGRNDGKHPTRFLAVFVGAKNLPIVLHPPERHTI